MACNMECHVSTRGGILRAINRVAIRGSRWRAIRPALRWNEHCACSSRCATARIDMACNTLPYKIAALRDAHQINWAAPWKGAAQFLFQPLCWFLGTATRRECDDAKQRDRSRLRRWGAASVVAPLSVVLRVRRCACGRRRSQGRADRRRAALAMPAPAREEHPPAGSRSSYSRSSRIHCIR